MSTSVWAPTIAGAVGAVGGLAGAALQRRWDVKQARKTDRAAQVRDAATRCGARLRSIDEDLARSFRQVTDRAGVEAWTTAQRRIDKALAEIELDAALFEEPYRERVALAIRVLRNPTNVAQYHWQREWTVSGTARRHLHDVLAAAIRGDDKPPGRLILMVEYAHALAWYEADMNDSYAEELTEQEVAHNRFLKRHPEIGAEVWRSGDVADRPAAPDGLLRRWLRRLHLVH